MKRKPIIPQLVRKPNRLRALYIISRRKLGKMTDEKIIVILSAAVFLLQLFIILTAVAAPMHASAQDSVKGVPVKPGGLQIGDRVPDVTINNIINYKTSTAKISDFKGKLLVLDFWASWCKGCLESFHHSSTVSSAFGDQIQVLYITYETREAVDKFLTRSKSVADKKLPIVYADSALKKLFPHKMVPHLVWIDAEGKLLQTTSAYDFNKPNIEKILGNKPVDFKTTKVDVMNFDSSKPLFDHGNGGAPNYLFRSMVSGYQPGLGGAIGRSEEKDFVRVFGINQTIPSLFKASLRLSPGTWRKSRIIYEGGLNRNDLEIGNWYEERSTKEYCYELILPAGRKDDMYPQMHQDLMRYFQITARVEYRPVSCLILKPLKKLKLNTSDGETRNNLRTNDGSPKYLKNDWLITLVYHLNDLPGVPPVIMEGIPDQKVNLRLNADLTDVPALNKALAAYGLTLQPEARMLEMLILSPLNTNSANSQN